MRAEEIDVVVIGAGQAGLAGSHELSAHGVAHVVLEQSDHTGGSWSQRWDSFCLVTPNHTMRLPGGPYSGDDPHGFLPKDEIVAQLQQYAAALPAPVRTGVQVASLTPIDRGEFDLRTSADQPIHARQVIVATGAFQQSHHPEWVASLPAGLPIIDAPDYRNPSQLPQGDVLVVGSGQTGCQIAEELVLSGRHVILSCGRAAWIPRRIENRDTVDWLLDTPFFEQPVASLPDPAARLLANPQATGARGGHDLHYRTLAALGVRLAGHVQGFEGDAIHFADDLAGSVAWGDERWAQLCGLIADGCTEHGAAVPDLPRPMPFDAAGSPSTLRLPQLGGIVLTMGYRPDYSWIKVPDAFDAMGFPVQRDGTSTQVAGLHFAGVHFQRSRKSSTLLGVGEDAAIVAQTVAAALN